MKNYNIRKAITSDLEIIQNFAHDLCAYEKDGFDKTIDADAPFSEDEKDFFKSCLVSEDSLILIAEVEGKPVGYFFGTAKGKQDYRTVNSLAEVNHIYIEEAYRGKGIGKGFSEEFDIWCKNKNIERIRVTVYNNNKSAIDFYEAQKFGKYGLILEKELI